MIQKRRVVSSSKLFVLFFLSLLATGASSLKACDACDTCEVECRTYRDGSSTSLTRDASSAGGGGGGGTSDTIALSDGPFGTTKVLRQCDFTPSYTIKCSGTYVFGEPIKFQGTTADQAALIIAADDVTVNLNGYSLTYEICGRQKSDQYFLGDDGVTKITYGRNNNVHGIALCPPRKNITIRNGAIRLFTGYGIRAIGMSLYGETLFNAGTSLSTLAGDDLLGSIENLTVNEITANNNKVGMVFMAGDTTTTIKSATPATNYILSDVRVLYSTANFNDDTGILFNTVNGGELEGSTANQNGGNTNGGRGLNPAGFDLQNSRKLLIKENCAELNKVVSGSGNSYGLYLHKNGGSTTSLSAGTYVTSAAAPSAVPSPNDDFYVIDSFVDSNKIQLNDWGFRDDLTPSSSVYMTNMAINNGSGSYSSGTTTITTQGSGNYYIYFPDLTSANGYGKLGTFTKAASLAVLNSLNAKGQVDNISIGNAPSAQIPAGGATSGNEIITPQAP